MRLVSVYSTRVLCHGVLCSRYAVDGVDIITGVGTIRFRGEEVCFTTTDYCIQLLPPTPYPLMHTLWL